MKRFTLILINLVIVSIVIVAAYAIAISRTYNASVTIVTPGLKAFTSCTPSGPSNPVTSVNVGNIQVGGTVSVTLYLMNSVNGTVNLSWNSTIRQSSTSLSDTWTMASGGFGASNDANHYWAGGYWQLLASNCTPDNSGSFSNKTFCLGCDVNGTTLEEGHVIATTYTVHASAAAVPGAYSWTLRLGVK